MCLWYTVTPEIITIIYIYVSCDVESICLLMIINFEDDDLLKYYTGQLKQKDNMN